MNESSEKRKVAVGIFVLLGIVFLILGILAIGNINETFKKKISVIALFDDVSGLQSGNNIWFSGVKIGMVESLEFYSHSKVKVTMKVERKAIPYIRKDAFVKVSTDGLIGNKILIIYGGSMQKAEVVENDTLAVEKSLSSEDVINTLQQNNKNFLSITNDIKLISNKMAAGEGTVGKLLNDNSLYEHLNQAAVSLQATSGRAQQLVNSLAVFSDKLNTPGSLINKLTTDTAVFNSIRNSAENLQRMSDSASAFVNTLNSTLSNSKTPAGVLLNDEESGSRLKETLKNLESGSKKLDEDLEALQHNFLFRGYFKNKK